MDANLAISCIAAETALFKASNRQRHLRAPKSKAFRRHFAEFHDAGIKFPRTSSSADHTSESLCSTSLLAQQEVRIWAIRGFKVGFRTFK